MTTLSADELIKKPDHFKVTGGDGEKTHSGIEYGSLSQTCEKPRKQQKHSRTYPMEMEGFGLIQSIYQCLQKIYSQ